MLMGLIKWLLFGDSSLGLENYFVAFTLSFEQVGTENPDFVLFNYWTGKMDLPTPHGRVCRSCEPHDRVVGHVVN